jgi:hypothetical protein
MNQYLGRLSTCSSSICDRCLASPVCSLARAVVFSTAARTPAGLLAYLRADWLGCWTGGEENRTERTPLCDHYDVCLGVYGDYIPNEEVGMPRVQRTISIASLVQ